MTIETDAIVVGSGASATSAAFPLVRAGLTVRMLDVGNVDARYSRLIPDAPFSEIRASDSAQHRYFLGDEFEGVPFGHLRVGAQLTPPRRHITQDTDTLTPVAADNFSGMESLALGGLGAGWGAVAVQFDAKDLEGYPIGQADLAPHYASVSARIGISGERDDLLRFYGDCASLQPPLDLDANGQLLLESYARKKHDMNRRGIHLGRARLAVLSKDLGERRAQQYRDMDFYSDSERSVFRPAFAVDELRSHAKFRYESPYLVERFRELDGGVEVDALHVASGRVERLRARRLVLAAGTLGSARIVLRSLDRYDTPLPLVANPYTYVPCLSLGRVGKAAPERRHSLTQVGVIYEPPADRDGPFPRVHAQAYSYRSLLLFKLVKEAPLPVPSAFRIMRELVNAFVILGIHHEDRPSAGKRCVLRRAGPGERDRLEVTYHETPEVEARQARAEKGLLRGFRNLGCWPLKRIRPGNGASIHYGGTLPMCREERELSATPEGRLRGTRSVFVADGSLLPHLPAKALTLTLMANAERVGSILARDLTGGAA